MYLAQLPNLLNNKSIMKQDISKIEDIQLMVNTFYGRIRENEILGPIFNNTIQDRWPEHLAKMYRFWESILLNGYSYHGAPFPPHAKLPIDRSHFDIWVGIFNNTVDDLFSGPIADEAKYRGALMANIFNSKIEIIKSKQNN